MAKEYGVIQQNPLYTLRMQTVMHGVPAIFIVLLHDTSDTLKKNTLEQLLYQF